MGFRGIGQKGSPIQTALLAWLILQALPRGMVPWGIWEIQHVKMILVLKITVIWYYCVLQALELEKVLIFVPILGGSDKWSWCFYVKLCSCGIKESYSFHTKPKSKQWGSSQCLESLENTTWLRTQGTNPPAGSFLKLKERQNPC